MKELLSPSSSTPTCPIYFSYFSTIAFLRSTWYKRISVLTFLWIFIFFWEFPCICSVFAFLLLMCLMAVSCSGPARDPRRAEENFTFHLVPRSRLNLSPCSLPPLHTSSSFPSYHRKWHSATLSHSCWVPQLSLILLHYLPCMPPSINQSDHLAPSPLLRPAYDPPSLWAYTKGSWFPVFSTLAPLLSFSKWQSNWHTFLVTS